MSVLKNKRKLSRTEYERTFEELYGYAISQTNKVPKRRKKWVTKEIDAVMNDAYVWVMDLSEAYFEKNVRAEAREKIAIKIIRRLNGMGRPLFTYWNVMGCTDKEMERWLDLIKREIDLLNNFVIEKNFAMSLQVLDWNKIDRVSFLKNMCDMHRYVHTKVIHANCAYDDSAGNLLIRLVDDALYNIMEANRKIPETSDEYKRRKEHICKAIASLNEMNRPILFYFNLMQYSERVMREWAGMLSEELKMLAALQKSDKERFSNLK